MIAFDVPTATRFAAAGDLEGWVHTYLTTGAWANHALSVGLRGRPRWWRGPLDLPLNRLIRCYGPEPTMEYPANPLEWEQRIIALAASFTDRHAIPPLIVEYCLGSLSIRDGNHRCEAMRRRGWRSAWAVIWYNSQADFEGDASAASSEPI